MSHLFRILRLAWPYLSRYRFRLFISVLAGVLFAASNASFMVAVNLVIARMVPQGEATVAASEPWKIPTWLQEHEATVRAIEGWWLASVDAVLPQLGEPMTVWQVLGGLLLFPLFAAVRGVCGYVSAYCMAWVSARFISELRCDLMERLYGLSLDFFQRARVGDLSKRVVEDTQSLFNSVNTVFSDLVKEPATIVAILIASLFIDWRLTVFALLILPICGIPIVILGNKVRRAARKTSDASVSQNNLMIESLNGIRVVKAYGLEERNNERFREHSESIVKHSVKRQQSEGLINPSVELISSFAFGALILFVIWNEVSLANMASVLTGVLLFFAPIRRLAKVHAVLQGGSVSADRLISLQEERPTVREEGEALAVREVQRSVVFDSVRFAYGEREVLRGFSLEWRRGECLGVVGESGSGKSTLVNLLLRFYDPTAGRILIDGRDSRQLSLSSLRGLIALVSQEIVIFDATVRENIAWGRGEATDAEVEEAARLAQAHDFIMQMPGGYDAPLGERGTLLSGGQRQRIAIARALVRRAPLLILDEATANLDSASEREVQAAIDSLTHDRTTLIIAHRLSTLVRCDRIIVLAEGQIVEEGSYEQLLRSGGVFARLAALQGISTGTAA